MEAPLIPGNEADRMHALKALHLLDTPMQENFERITRITQAIFNVPIVSFTLIDSDRQWFKSVQGLDICETSREVSFCGHVINQAALFIINDATKDPRFADNPLVTGEPFIRFYAGYPVHSADGFKIGSLCIIDTKPHDFTKAQLAPLKDMAAMLEAELKALDARKQQVETVEELERAKRQALVDGLTRLWNRSGIENIVRKQMHIAKESKENFAVALVDIDNFKAVNDTYGHNAGDAILRNVAKRLLRGYRATDSVGRWGGEEFLVVLNSADQENFFNAAERARNIISETPIIFENLEITITVTTGLTSFDWTRPCEIIDLISEADQALYMGKHTGKNVVKISLSVKDNNAKK